MSKIDLNTKDKEILDQLQQNGRITNAELAEQVNLSPSACLRRVQHLEASGIIQGYHAVLDQTKAGKPASVFVEISLTRQNEESLDAFESAVKQCSEIMACYLMSGNFDYLLKVIVKDAQDYERIHRKYLAHFPNVAQIRSNFALRVVSKNTVLSM